MENSLVIFLVLHKCFLDFCLFCVISSEDVNVVTCRARKGASMNGDTTRGTGLHSLFIIRYPLVQTHRRTLSTAKSTRTTGPGEEPHQTTTQTSMFRPNTLTGGGHSPGVVVLMWTHVRLFPDPKEVPEHPGHTDSHQQQQEDPGLLLR